MDFYIKDKLISVLGFLQVVLTLSIIILTFVIIVFLDNFNYVRTIYTSLLIASIVCCVLFICLNWTIETELIIDHYISSNIRYIVMLLIISLQSLTIPFIAIFILNIIIFKIHTNHIIICFLSSIFISSILCYRVFFKLNKFLYRDSDISLNRLKFLIIFNQVLFIIIDLAILFYVSK
jgi:hypothetical protein